MCMCVCVFVYNLETGGATVTKFLCFQIFIFDFRRKKFGVSWVGARKLAFFVSRCTGRRGMGRTGQP